MKEFIKALSNILKSNTPEAKRLNAKLNEYPERSAELVAHQLGSATQPIKLGHKSEPEPTIKYPISKHSEETGWVFVKEFEGSYGDALDEARKLQLSDNGFSYRIWDDREEVENEQ